MSYTVLALGRNEEKARERFSYCFEDAHFHFIAQDINRPLCLPDLEKVDFVLHLASNTHPVAYATDPIGTILTNIEGTKNMLDFAVKHQADRFAFASSNEIYGENRGDVEKFDESYCGYIDYNTLRAGYPGFAGQKIVPSTLKKAEKLMAFLKEHGKEDLEVEVDGNITLENARKLRAIGADTFVAGTSSVFKGNLEEYDGNILHLRKTIQ